MENEPQATPEGLLIAERREALRPKLSQNRAAKLVDLSGNRWRHIEKGFQTIAAGVRAPVVAPPETLAKMARLLGITPEELKAVDREDAAEALARLEQQIQEQISRPVPKLPRNAPNSAVLGEVDKALGIHPHARGTLLPMSATERQLLRQARNKLFRVGSEDAGFTEEEVRVLTKFIEDDELRTLHVRIDWLPRSEQLEVSQLVNDLHVRVEDRWRAEGYNNESEYLPDYAQPNPLPVEGIAPDPADFPSQVPTFTKESKDAVETSAAAGASAEAVENQKIEPQDEGLDETDLALSAPEIRHVPETSTVLPDLLEDPEDPGGLTGGPGVGGDVEEDGPDAAADG